MIGRVAILIFCLSGFSTPSSADTFLVRAYGCPGRNPDRSLTGFKTKKFDGILTALHGVLGCKPIKAVPDQGQPLIDELKISGVDIENDIALLTSPELSNKFPDGFDEDAAAVLPNSVLRVQGHPLGISKLTTTFRARTPAIVALRDLLPTGGDFDKLQHRLSPSTSIQVISIDGTILPGHSGAPIFNTQGRIVGVASGGLLGGLAQINWAVPIGNIRFTNPDGNAILDQIARMDAALLFAMDAPVINPGPVSTSERILAAVHANDADSLRRALKVVDIPQHTKNVALSDAAGAGYEDLIPILVTAGAKVDNDVLCETDWLNSRAIQLLGNLRDANPNFPCPHGTPLLTVLSYRTRPNVEERAIALLSIPGIDVNAQDAHGDTALHKAVWNGYLGVVRALLSMKTIQMNAKNLRGQTPADVACFSNQKDALFALLGAGAKGGIYSSSFLRDCTKKE